MISMERRRKKVAVIHTFLYSVEDLKELFQRVVPEVEMMNIIDDSLLQEALVHQGVTVGIVRRMVAYALQAEALGADVILNQCSSVGEVVDIASKMLRIPYVRIDGPMAEEAVALGDRIAVIATAVSTVEPSSRLVEHAAEGIGRGGKIHVDRCFVDGAYDALLKEKDREKHDRLIVNRVREEAKCHDVIVLAQGSMYRLLPLLSDIPIPVLCSFESGVAQLRPLLNLD